MKVATAAMMTELQVRFELKDLTPHDQRELFVMSLRSLGFTKVLSKKAIAEIDAHLIALGKAG